MPQFITVVVPFQNNRNEIGYCCESLLAQTYPPDCYELIFVDNNSNDGSGSIVSGRPRIQLIQEPTPGSYAARNRGIRAAKGQIIAFTDADCIAAPLWLSSIDAALSTDGFTVALGAYSALRAKFPARTLIAYENAKNRYIFASRDWPLYYGYTNNMAVRRRVFDEYGYFPEVARGGDAQMVRRVVQSGEAGRAAIRYTKDMFVDHLEFNSVLGYYQKVFIHSRSLRTLQSMDVMRPLTIRERHRAFRDMVRHEHYSVLEACLAYLVIGLGMLFWLAGWVRPLPQTLRTPEGRH